MENYFEERSTGALEELKRADHLLYVSLKYTRTKDVFLNIISRLISAFEISIQDLLKKANEKGMIKIIPITWKDKLELIPKIMGPSSKKYLKLYNKLKLIKNCQDIKAKEEFRKGVAIKVNLKKPITIKVDDLVNYYKQTQEFVDMVIKFIKK